MTTNLAALQSYLAGKPDLLIAAECFTLSLPSGSEYLYTNADRDVTITDSGTMVSRVFSASGVQIDGLKYHATIGLETDEQSITLAAKVTDLVDGQPILLALRNGYFDGAHIERERAFLSAWDQPAIGSKTLFYGRVSSIGNIGRLTAQIKVKSELVVLDADFPRNIYQANCLHTLYDAGCTLDVADFEVSGAVGASPSAISIPWASATANYYDLGRIRFTSGALLGLIASVRHSDGAALLLASPLDRVPAPGDTFIALPGCDHTRGAQGCAKFANLVHFRGFPYIPPPKTGI